MKAIVIGEDADRTLTWADVPTPRLDPESCLVRVHATAVNRADLLQRRGFYPPPPGESEILGLEAAGTIAEKGANVSEWQVGDRVCFLLAGGGYAQYVTVHRRMLLAIPAHLDFDQAAAIPEAFYTAFVNLALEAGLVKGERVLVQAGGSGVGTAAIQLARAMGAPVLVTVGSDEKLQRCLDLGADAGINYKREDFAARIGELTGGEGVDVILDCVGGSYFEKHLTLLRNRGRLVIIGLMGGAKAEINLAPLVAKRLRVLGSVLRTRSLAEKIAITDAFRERVMPLFVSSVVRPVIDSTYALVDAAQAHEHVAANRNFGKVVLRVTD